jgi:uncharacterized membrane protein YjdF
MFKIIAFSSIPPSISALYGVFTSNFKLALNSAYTIFLIAAFVLLHKKAHIFKISTRNSFIIFILLSIFLGRALNFYALVPQWDKLLHFLSGFLFAQAGKEIYLKLGGNKQNKAVLNYFALFSAFSAATLWEIWEFASDKILNTNAQNNSLDDTMYDIVAGSVGGIIKVIYNIFL